METLLTTSKVEINTYTDKQKSRDTHNEVHKIHKSFVHGRTT